MSEPAISKPKRLNIPHQQQKVVVRVMVVGYQTVGKSTLVARLVGRPLPATEQATLGVEYLDVHLDQKTTAYHLNFFDFSGRDLYLQIRNEFYRESNVLLLVFDLNYKRTFEQLEAWIAEAGEYGFAGVKIIVGNKSDQIRIIPEDQTKSWAKEKGCLYAETCAKQGKGIQELTQLILKAVK